MTGTWKIKPHPPHKRCCNSYLYHTITQLYVVTIKLGVQCMDWTGTISVLGIRIPVTGNASINKA